MANWSTPFASTGDKRFPTNDESQSGYVCGAAPRELMNGEQYRVEAELGHLITFAGITPTDDRMTQVREAVEALIDAATGGGDTSQFLLVSQARARLPIFPEIQSVGNTMGATSPGTGQVRVPGNVTFLHRGIFPVTTTQTDFSTDASKTYHLRWNPADGFVLRDLASGTYNPGTLTEANRAFDSTYDDMLVARVVTNSSNVPTVTNLANRARFLEERVYAYGPMTGNVQSQGAYRTITDTWNWARSPLLTPTVGTLDILNGDDLDQRLHPLAAPFAGFGVNDRLDRYGTLWTVVYDMAQNIEMRARLDA